MVDPHATASALPALPAPPEALVTEAWILHAPGSGERSGLMRPEAAALVDGLLARVARGRGALDVAMGEQLDALAVGDRVLRLGYSNLGDYARERLGVSPTTARLAARLARELRSRPLLREAVRSGELSARKAQAVLPVARAGDEARWVDQARRDTVRALEAAVREARGAARASVGGTAEAAGSDAPRAGPDEERWERFHIDMAPEDRERLERALDVAKRALEAGAPRWQRLEAICQEYLGAHPSEPLDDEGPSYECEPALPWLEDAKEVLEAESGRWDFLEPVPAVAAPVERNGDPGADPLALDARLRELAAMRCRWDVLLGHLGMLMKTVGLWRDAGFASFGHYCEERLGMAARTVEQRAALAKRAYDLPGLREAMSDGRLPYEKARLVARVADEETVGAWIERARATTALDLRRELDEEDAQMCARGALQMTVPRRVRVLVDAVARAAREAEGRWVKTGEALGLAAEHFVATWERLPPQRRTPHRKVLERDGGRCQVPGCSRAAAHAHHVVFRSAGGGDGGENLVSLCAAHHLHGVHLGWIGVRGEAPGALAWRMAAPPA